MIHKATTTLVLMTMLLTMACTQNRRPGWQLDVQKSKVTWNTGKMMGGHAGYFLFTSGNLEFSPAGEPVRGTFEMDMNSLRSTENPVEENRRKTDANLRKPQFFNVDEYPLAIMEVTKISRKGSTADYRVSGDLTIKGIKQPIAFDATILIKGGTSHISANVDISHQLWDLDQRTRDLRRVDSLSAIRDKLVPGIHVALDILMHK